MIPTAKFIADLHRQVIAHAGHTKKSRANLMTLLFCYPVSLLLVTEKVHTHVL
jgi:hypothetical protein